jgi:hypothetical protein
VKSRQYAIRHALGILGIAVAAAFLVSGCSEMGFPAVHDMPTPRADTTLTPDQVKQATDDLICQRDHLESGAQAGTPAATPPKASPAAQKPCTPAPSTTGSVVPASAYAKP